MSGDLSFRPLPGYLISQFAIPAVCALNNDSFRPLPGYLISQYFVRTYWNILPTVSFPSPSGVSHFSIILSKQENHVICFRPLPGYLISQFKQLFQYHQLRDCFRPLPGYLISQFNVMGLQDLSIKFPSPSGVSHFSIYFVKPLRISIICFRPLPGYLISQSAMLF